MKNFGNSSLASSRRMNGGNSGLDVNNADGVDINIENAGEEYANTGNGSFPDGNYAAGNTYGNVIGNNYGSSIGNSYGSAVNSGTNGYSYGNAVNGGINGYNYGSAVGNTNGDAINSGTNGYNYGSSIGNNYGDASNGGINSNFPSGRYGPGNFGPGNNGFGTNGSVNYGSTNSGFGTNGSGYYGPAGNGPVNYDSGDYSNYNDMRNAAYDAGYRAAMDDIQYRGRRPKKKRKHHPIRNTIIVLLLILVAGAASLGAAGYKTLGNLMENSIDYGFRSTPQTLNDGVAYDESMMGKKSIALVGLDSRDGNLLSGNSDTMIVATMDNSRRTVKMFSVYRDTYLDVIVGEAVYRKANNAYATGGPSRMVTMLNRNLDLNITDYVTVDFKALQVAVDDLGGIDVEMTDDEVVWMNDNGWETAEVCGVQWWYVEPGAGTYHLNGVQAVSYARIRKTTGNDFKRTSRQRLVISKVISRAKKAGPVALMKMAEDVFPLIRTSLSENDLLRFAMGVVFYDTDNAQGFPFVHLESDVKGMDVVVPVTLEHNVKELHKWLFGVEDYAPSKTVRDISSHIASVSGFDDSDIGRAAEYSANGANPNSGSEADGH